MTPRERVLTSMNHREPDRVPVDCSGHRSSGISAIAYRNLREFLGLPPKPIRVYDPIQQLAIVDEDVLDRFGIDTIELGRAFATEDHDWQDWSLPDGSPCKMPAWVPLEREQNNWVIRSATGQIIARMPEGCLYFEQCHYPYLDNDSNFDDLNAVLQECMWTAIASPPGPIASGPNGHQILQEGAKKLRTQTDRAIIGLFGGNLLEIGQFLFRNDNFLMMLADDPKRAHSFLDRLVELHLGNLERFLGAVGPSIDIVLFGDDLGMQSGPQMSPKMYREFFQPRHRSMWQTAKKLANVKVMLHCCGGVRELLPALIEAGLDAINPVQIACKGMNPTELKSEFGHDMVFWGGGCDTQTILPDAGPDEIRRHVREMVGIFSPGGGFVFQQVHNILANVPPQNIVAMFEAVHAR